VIDPFLREVKPTEAVKPSRQFQRCASILDRSPICFTIRAITSLRPNAEGLRNASIQ
jgi:hypothetical protein